MLLKPATPLTVLLLAAFALLLLSTLSTPIVKGIPLATHKQIDYGVFGYCKGDTCTNIHVGYSVGESQLSCALWLLPTLANLCSRQYPRRGRWLRPPVECSQIIVSHIDRASCRRFSNTGLSGSCGCLTFSRAVAFPALFTRPPHLVSTNPARLVTCVFGRHIIVCATFTMGWLDRSRSDNSASVRRGCDLCDASHPREPKGTKTPNC